MPTYDANVQNVLTGQTTPINSRERCSADPDKLTAIGRAVGHQIRIKRSATEYALYTVCETRQENPENIVRMLATGASRLGSTTPFDATVDSQVPHPSYTDAQAETNSEFVERLDDNGIHTALIAIAPHGGNIEPWTDKQAERVASQMADQEVSCWRCKGWKKGGGAFLRWHITSTDLHEASFPLLNTIINRGFSYAVAFHGFSENNILIGGGAGDQLKQDIKTAIESVISGSGISVDIAGPTSNYGGDSPRNIVNRLANGGGIQIEQCEAARTNYWQGIADAVVSVLRPYF
ncbi:poly-gamma-glutamate hydrolase family protein [Pannus brasiliensis CCIBt3594]|uniref:Poly-gamma-glutamate hydrolase family protein n=1 Tax=Pannus brasiliensis CCIBt3594 TaxID=1427578 RepID=A0AAW9R060_9CHRO